LLCRCISKKKNEDASSSVNVGGRDILVDVGDSDRRTLTLYLADLARSKFT